ncbi:MAG: single-stranded DNA-binding protein [Bacillota bacterium]
MNKAILIGNLTRDPEVRTTQSGVSMCSFTIAVNRRFTNADGSKQTDFIPIVTWRKTAELCGQYLAKGRKVAVIGEIQTRSYDAKDGTKRFVTEVVADEVEFLSPRGEQGGGSYEARPSGGHASPAMQDDLDGFADIEDDELPF